jgi:CRISPR-associated exonuclease Cas4
VLEQCGVENPSGILEYPKMRKTEEVYLSDVDQIEIGEMLVKMEEIVSSEICPDRLPVSKCHSCSYFDFCWSGEEIV